MEHTNGSVFSFRFFNKKNQIICQYENTEFAGNVQELQENEKLIGFYGYYT